MGRQKKLVMDADGLDKRSLGYYSTPAFVAEYLTGRMLEEKPDGHRVLDPCVGREEMVISFAQAGKDVLGLDIFDYGHHGAAAFVQQDFLQYYAKRRDQIKEHGGLEFDYYIANPPYNCHESGYIRDNKRSLQALFPDIGTLNMYSMFLAALVHCAKPGAMLGIITSDSFLTSRMHSPLRQFVQERCHIHDLLLCPTDLFHGQQADVRTCLMVLEKLTPREQGLVNGRRMTRTMGRPLNSESFARALRDRTQREVPERVFSLTDVRDHGEWLVDCPASIRHLFQGQRLADEFRCLTGISTGSDRKYLRAKPEAQWTRPFYKNPGKRRFYAAPDGYLPENFLELARTVPNFLVRNQRYLFREGIACSSMGVAFGACYRPQGALFGVNANFVDLGDDLWWLLAYLNSSLVTYLVRGVLLRSNMITSGYVSRIPLLPLSADAKRTLAALAHVEYERCRQGAAADAGIVAAVNAVIYREAGLPPEDIQHVQEFCGDLLRRT